MVTADSEQPLDSNNNAADNREEILRYLFLSQSSFELL